MERVDVKLMEWKAAYDALEAARAALKRAAEVGAPEAELRELRARVEQLRTDSDAFLYEVGHELACRNRSPGPH